MEQKIGFTIKKIDDIHHPLFQNKIHTTQELILTSFKNEKVMSQTLNNVISKGMEYLNGLQQVVDIFESFSTRVALNVVAWLCFEKIPVSVQYSSGLKASISLSRSTIILRADD